MSMHTIKSLLTDHSIVIPMIQRDYAQGRTDEHATRIRKEIIAQLKEATLNRKPLDFDFIYGTIRENQLRILDGQQRLTTLFLLHWYIGGYRKRALPSYLDQFSYETRTSARDFFHALRKETIVKLPRKKLSETIRLQKWFHEVWCHDPSVKGALVMLDAIHEVFGTVETNILPDLMQEEPTVSFQYLDLDGYELDEKLYIKMNSRGKALTSFEHFKAQFEQMLERNGWIDERNEFARKIETVWSDLLWPHRDSTTHTIDEVFLNVFRYVTSIEAHRNEQIRLQDQDDLSSLVMMPEQFSRVYYDQETLSTLFKSLDAWLTIEEMSISFTRYVQEIPFIRSNVLDHFLKGTLSNEEQLIVYAILRIKRNASSEQPELVRVLWNLLQGIRQNQNGKYNSNLRFTMFSKLYRQIDDLIDGPGNLIERLERLEEPFNKRVVEHEIQKQILITHQPSSQSLIYQLEDHPLLRGLTHRVFPTFEKCGEAAMEAIMGVLDASPVLVARAMLSIDDYSVGIGHSNLGSRYVFGGDRYKSFIFTHQIGNSKQEENKNLQVVMDELFEALLVRNGTIENRLQQMVEEWKGEMDWRYYFIRYESILTEKGDVFVFKDEEAFKIERLRGVNLQSAHSNPLYDEVVRQIPSVEDEQWEYYYSELSKITVGKTNLFMTKDGWNISGGDINKKDFLLLRERATGDVIETGVQFVHWLIANQSVPY